MSPLRTDAELQIAREQFQSIEAFLQAARQTHSPVDYERLAAPFLLELQRRHQEVVESLSAGQTLELAA